MTFFKTPAPKFLSFIRNIIKKRKPKNPPLNGRNRGAGSHDILLIDEDELDYPLGI